MTENIWYVTGDKTGGFTSDPEQALRDLTGAPIIAPGHLIGFQKRLVKKARIKIKEAKEQAWSEGYMACRNDFIQHDDLGDPTENPYAEKGSVQ